MQLLCTHFLNRFLFCSFLLRRVSGLHTTAPSNVLNVQRVVCRSTWTHMDSRSDTVSFACLGVDSLPLSTSLGPIIPLAIQATIHLMTFRSFSLQSSNLVLTLSAFTVYTLTIRMIRTTAPLNMWCSKPEYDESSSGIVHRSTYLSSFSGSFLTVLSFPESFRSLSVYRSGEFRTAVTYAEVGRRILIRSKESGPTLFSLSPRSPHVTLLS